MSLGDFWEDEEMKKAKKSFRVNKGKLIPARRKRVAAKAKVEAPKAAPLGGDSLALLLQALPELYPHDDSSPGVVLAWLPGHPPTRSFYASICRYEGNRGTGKRILYQGLGATVEEAVQNVSAKLINSTKVVQKLAVRVRRQTKL